jgi:hypothetical protein
MDISSSCAKMPTFTREGQAAQQGAGGASAAIKTRPRPGINARGADQVPRCGEIEHMHRILAAAEVRLGLLDARLGEGRRIPTTTACSSAPMGARPP